MRTRRCSVLSWYVPWSSSIVIVLVGIAHSGERWVITTDWSDKRSRPVAYTSGMSLKSTRKEFPSRELSTEQLVFQQKANCKWA